MNYLIIAAGGSGERMKSKDNKVFLKINNHAILYWTLRAFEEDSTVDAIVISARTADQKKIEEIIKQNKIKKVVGIVPAGKIRQETVSNALNWLKTMAKEDDLVGIHNGANPFVLRSEIKNVFDAVREYRSALLAYPARDTIKITDKDNIVSSSPVRSSCWHAQTPQVAFYGDLIRAFSAAQKKNFTGTDDVQLLELIGIRAKIVPCSRYNFKITFPEDLSLAKKILPSFIKENKYV